MSTSTVLRPALATVAVVACLPYLTLKICWLTGSSIGLADPSILDDKTLEIGNTVTLGMEVVAAALAVVLAGHAARRLPGRLLAVPTFVGTGLLGGILLLLPIEAVMSVGGWLPAPPPRSGPDPIQGWTYQMVYAGFALLGLSLLGLFAIEARRRWVEPGGWTTRVGTWPSSGSRAVPTVVAALVMLAACLAEATIAVTARELGAHQVVSVVASALAAVAVVVLAARCPARLRGTLPLVAAYAASAAVAAWGLYFAVLIAVPNPLRGDSPVPGGLLWAEVARGLAGLATVLLLRRLSPIGAAAE